MYKSLNHIAKMFDISPSYIKKHYLSDLKEGVHFVYIGTMKRFHIEEMKKLLVTHTKPKGKSDQILDKFLL